MRALILSDPQAFVDLVFPGARVLRVHQTRLKGTLLETDAVLEVEQHGVRLLVHLEVQTYSQEPHA